LSFNFPVGLEYPTPVAGGAIRYLPAIVLTHTIVFTGLWWLGTASYRLYSGAMSMLVIVPINVFISLLAVRSLVPFSCGELAGAIRKSTVLLGLSAAGPAITLIGAGWRADVSMQTALVAVILCAVGWICGLRLSRHPLGQDVFGARDGLLKTPVATRALAAWVRLSRGAAVKRAPSAAEEQEPPIEQGIENTVIRGPTLVDGSNGVHLIGKAVMLSLTYRQAQEEKA
jgi:hypothetical protein